MLKPSYTNLMEVINEGREISDEVTSRYVIVIAASKRARQIIANRSEDKPNNVVKPVSTAVNELYNKDVRITKTENDEGMNIGIE